MGAKIRFIDPVTHKSMTVAEMLDTTYTDGFLVLQHGQILAESYRNGLTQDEPHLVMSVSKSIMGTLAGILAGRGELDPAKLVTEYVPEMKGTVYEGATVRNLLDMSVDDPEERAALKTSRGTAKEYDNETKRADLSPVVKNCQRDHPLQPILGGGFAPLSPRNTGLLPIYFSKTTYLRSQGTSLSKVNWLPW